MEYYNKGAVVLKYTGSVLDTIRYKVIGSILVEYKIIAQINCTV